MADVVIRVLETAADMAACEAVQMATWEMPDPADSVPVHQLLTAAKYGGLVLGAFDGDRMVGLSYAFVGLHAGRPIWCSHMLAVLPEYRGKGIGLQLKLEQRRIALERGIATVHWTYDPLELVNGTLNISRLGGIARTYVRDLYGSMQDGLNAGLPSDRLVVEWELDSERVRQAVAGDVAPIPDGEELPIPVLPNFREIRRKSPGEALQWRLALRGALEAAFKAGYTLTGVEGYQYILTR